MPRLSIVKCPTSKLILIINYQASRGLFFVIYVVLTLTSRTWVIYKYYIWMYILKLVEGRDLETPKTSNVCVCVCVRACVRMCVGVCVCVCVHACDSAMRACVRIYIYLYEHSVFKS